MWQWITSEHMFSMAQTSLGLRGEMSERKLLCHSIRESRFPIVPRKSFFSSKFFTLIFNEDKRLEGKKNLEHYVTIFFKSSYF